MFLRMTLMMHLSPTPVNEIQVMTLTHGSGHNWELGDQFQIDVESVLSKNITFAGDGYCC
jgi:hypothetical protein